MRKKSPYFFYFCLPFLLLSLWGCATVETPSSRSIQPTVLSSFDDNDSDSRVTEDHTPSEPESTVDEELRELAKLGVWLPSPPAQEEEEALSDFPVTLNEQVEFYIDYFQNRQREMFSGWLERSTRYLPMIREELREAGLPEDLAYLPMIESGYSLTAYSSARAVGPWQFMRPTAQGYGLKINAYVDERRDPEKSTKAAVALLGDLYEKFGDWYLAVAAYNAGGGKIQKGLENYNTEDFWELAQQQYLNKETKRYVPKLIAAIIIAKDPEKYGFCDIHYQAPLEYETVEVAPGTSLRAVQVACGADLEQLRTLNRQLPRLVTPPNGENYSIKVPVGSKEEIIRNLPKVRATVSTEYKTHVVASADETLSELCSRYDVNKLTLLKANNLRKSKLSQGQRLRIPVRNISYVLADKAQALHAEAGGERRELLHTVQTGETISHICRKYNITPQQIAAWNQLDNVNTIRAGRQLTLFVEDATGMSGVITAQEDSSSRTAQPPLTYLVRKGDTIWTIARRFNLSPKQLRAMNNLPDNVIHPGAQLRVGDGEMVETLTMGTTKRAPL